MFGVKPPAKRNRSTQPCRADDSCHSPRGRGLFIARALTTRTAVQQPRSVRIKLSCVPFQITGRRLEPAPCIDGASNDHAIKVCRTWVVCTCRHNDLKAGGLELLADDLSNLLGGAHLARIRHENPAASCHCAPSPVGSISHSQREPQRSREGRRSRLARPNILAEDLKVDCIAPCRAAVEEYDLCQGSRGFDCSTSCCAWCLTIGVSASILGACPRHLPTRFTLTRAVQHAQKHFAPPLRALGRTQELAASRTTSKTKVISPTGRISFAKIAEPLEVPYLLDLQIDSFDWLIGNEAWRARVETALGQGRTDINTKSGLEEIFEEISPIEDFSGTMSLSFRDHRFEPPKNSVDECKERDVTYAAPLFVTAEFMNNETGEIKSQTVFMGDFPLMTDKGTFVINGTERVVVSQLVRSPGFYFEQTTEKT